MSQTSIDASIGGLVTGIHQAYEVIMENRSLSKINSSKNVLVDIAQVVQECAQFVIKYSETKNFCMLIMPVIFIAISYFHRVLSRKECFLGNGYQGRQLQLEATNAYARASRPTSSEHPIRY